MNKSWNKEFAYQTLRVVDTALLSAMIGIICSTGLVGRILTVLTIIRYLALVQPFQLASWRMRYKTIRIILGLWAASFILALPAWICSKVIEFKDGVESCAFDLTSPDDILWYTLYLTFFFPLSLFLVCYILILCYTWETYQQNKDARCHSPSIPRQRVMKLTKMVLVLVAVFILSAAPYHILQLLNLRMEQPKLVFYVSCYLSICLSFASSSINPFHYILLSRNFQKCLPG